MKPSVPKDERAPGCKRTPFIADRERFRLLYGPYEPPRFEGGFLTDALRGKVEFSKYSNARIPWPIFKRQSRRGSGGLVLCGDLVSALEKESTPAICYYWGVHANTVARWRGALGFHGLTPGAERLVKIGVELCKLPQSQAKLSAGARTRGMSQEGRAAIRSAVLERFERKREARQAFYDRTGRFPKKGRSKPWLPVEERLLEKHTTAELTRILGRTREGIQRHRHALNIRLRSEQGT